MTKCYLFSSYDLFNPNEAVQNEFLDKHLALKDFFDEFELLTFNNELSTHPIVIKNKVKTRAIKNVKDFPLDGDIYFTFGNFINFELNSKYYRTGIIDGNVLPDKRLLNTFNKLDKLITKNNLTVHQYMSDPMDLKFKNSKIITPDSKTIENEEYFPLYQYYHFSNGNDVFAGKKKDVIVGSTCYNEFRTSEFNKYLLKFYSEQKDNDKISFYISGYQNMFFQINNFIDHEKFFDEISKTRFGIVLKTYSEDVISANKISQFLSNGCIPILVDGCDDKSNFIPQDLKDQYTIKDSLDLINKFKDGYFNYELASIDWQHFKDFLNKDNSENIINNYIKNNI